jgi:hypothetical protein
MKPPVLDSFDRYDAQPGRRYQALETDSPKRWFAFAVSNPQFKPAKPEESNHAPSDS